MEILQEDMSLPGLITFNPVAMKLGFRAAGSYTYTVNLYIFNKFRYCIIIDMIYLTVASPKYHSLNLALIIEF